MSWIMGLKVIPTLWLLSKYLDLTQGLIKKIRSFTSQTTFNICFWRICTFLFYLMIMMEVMNPFAHEELES